MEYYADPGKSVYRPQYTIETLEKLPNVRIMRDLKVERIQETADGVDVHCTSLERNAAEVIGAKTVLVAAGAIGTARILLRSLGLFDIDIPFVSKPHAFSALLHSTMLGKIGTTKTHALCQLLLIDEHRTAEGLCSGVAQLYSYKTLLLFRLLGSLPLPAPQALRVAAALAPALMVADIRFPGLPGVGRTLRLQRTGETDRLELAMDDSAAEQAAESASHRRLKKAMKTLGLLPIRNMRLPHASASHHAGTVAVGNTEAPLSCDSSGLVTGLRRTYVADASMFRLLPPQPHTLTLMANARRVAGCALEAL
jgi:choline dehydrogenase-like flavoprotein